MSVREAEIGGVRVPYLLGLRSAKGFVVETTQEAARAIEIVRQGQAESVVWLRAPDKDGEMRDVGKVWIEEIRDLADDEISAILLPAPPRAEIVMSFRP